MPHYANYDKSALFRDRQKEKEDALKKLEAIKEAQADSSKPKRKSTLDELVANFSKEATGSGDAESSEQKQSLQEMAANLLTRSQERNAQRNAERDAERFAEEARAVLDVEKPDPTKRPVKRSRLQAANMKAGAPDEVHMLGRERITPFREGRLNPRIHKMEDEAQRKMQQILQAQQPLQARLERLHQPSAMPSSRYLPPAEKTQEQLAAEEKRNMMANILKKVSALPGCEADVALLTEQLNDMGGPVSDPIKATEGEVRLNEQRAEEARRKPRVESFAKAAPLFKMQFGQSLAASPKESEEEQLQEISALQQQMEQQQRMQQLMDAQQAAQRQAMSSATEVQAVSTEDAQVPAVSVPVTDESLLSMLPPEILAEMQLSQTSTVTGMQKSQSHSLTNYQSTFPGADPAAEMDPAMAYAMSVDPAMAAIVTSQLADPEMAADPTMAAIVSSQLYQLASVQSGGPQAVNLPPWSPLLNQAKEEESVVDKLARLRQEQETAQAALGMWLQGQSPTGMSPAAPEREVPKDETKVAGWTGIDFWEGDWTCPSCTTLMFAAKDECEWCKVKRADGLPASASLHGRWSKDRERVPGTWEEWPVANGSNGSAQGSYGKRRY